MNEILVNGPGIILIKELVDKQYIDKTNRLIENMTNTKIYEYFDNKMCIENFYEKFCKKNPSLFINYFKKPMFNHVIQSYLGPKYEVNSKLTIVPSETPEEEFGCSYHMGVMNKDELLKYPKNIHTSCQNLTLQMYISHSYMSKEMRSIKLIPYSQTYSDGYLKIQENQDLVDLCHDNYVEFDLEKGDCIVYNSALYRSISENKRGPTRISNMLEINSAFSKPMETVDKDIIADKVSEHLNYLHLTPLEMECIHELIFNKYDYPRILHNEYKNK